MFKKIYLIFNLKIIFYIYLMKKKKKVKIKDPIENFDFMKTNKDNIKNIIKDNTFLPINNFKFLYK